MKNDFTQRAWVAGWTGFGTAKTLHEGVLTLVFSSHWQPKTTSRCWMRCGPTCCWTDSTGHTIEEMVCVPRLPSPFQWSSCIQILYGFIFWYWLYLYILVSTGALLVCLAKYWSHRMTAEATMLRMCLQAPLYVAGVKQRSWRSLSVQTRRSTVRWWWTDTSTPQTTGTKLIFGGLTMWKSNAGNRAEEEHRTSLWTSSCCKHQLVLLLFSFLITLRTYPCNSLIHF